MNPTPTPNKAVRITADLSAIPFPCWIYCNHPDIGWWRCLGLAMFENDSMKDAFPDTHWLPDSSVRPSFAPEEDKPEKPETTKPTGRLYDSVESMCIGEGIPVPLGAATRDMNGKPDCQYCGGTGRVSYSAGGESRLDMCGCHAPSVPAVGGLIRERVRGTLELIKLNSPSLEAATGQMLAALAPYLAPQPTGKQAEGVRDSELIDFIQAHAGSVRLQWKGPVGRWLIEKRIKHPFETDIPDLRAALRSSNQTGEGRG